MIEKYKEFWLLNYDVKHLRVSYDFEYSVYRYRNQYEQTISTILLVIFCLYFEKQVGLYRNYLNFDALWDIYIVLFRRRINRNWVGNHNIIHYIILSLRTPMPHTIPHKMNKPNLAHFGELHHLINRMSKVL